MRQVCTQEEPIWNGVTSLKVLKVYPTLNYSTNFFQKHVPNNLVYTVILSYLKNPPLHNL